MKTFKQQLTDIVTSVFANEKSFIEDVIGYRYDSDKSIEEFYMAGERCRVEVSANYKTYTKTVSTQDVLGWYENLKEEMK